MGEWETLLDEVVNRLVRGINPEQIWLFGSHAYGTPDKGSDLDLLVIVPSSELPNYRRDTQAYRLLLGLTVPVDVIVMTRSEVERARRVRTSLVSTVFEKGKLLYG
jgi:predicted nucleotidyltransferase